MSFLSWYDPRERNNNYRNTAAEIARDTVSTQFPSTLCNYSYYALESNDLKNGFEFKENGLKGFFRFLFMSPMWKIF